MHSIYQIIVNKIDGYWTTYNINRRAILYVAPFQQQMCWSITSRYFRDCVSFQALFDGGLLLNNEAT